LISDQTRVSKRYDHVSCMPTARWMWLPTASLCRHVLHAGYSYALRGRWLLRRGLLCRAKPFAWDEHFSPTKQRLQARACGLVAPTAGRNHRPFRDSLSANALPGSKLPYLYPVADSPEERLPQGPLASHHRYPQQLGRSKFAYGLDHMCHSSDPLVVCTYVARMAMTCMSARTYPRTQRLVSGRTGFLMVPHMESVCHKDRIHAGRHRTDCRR
jgi:hypothetical protein